MSTKRPGQLRGIAKAVVEGRELPWNEGPYGRATHRPEASPGEIVASKHRHRRRTAWYFAQRAARRGETF
jgi:hypothetical protein